MLWLIASSINSDQNCRIGDLIYLFINILFYLLEIYLLFYTFLIGAYKLIFQKDTQKIEGTTVDCDKIKNMSLNQYTFGVIFLLKLLNMPFLFSSHLFSITAEYNSSAIIEIRAWQWWFFFYIDHIISRHCLVFIMRGVNTNWWVMIFSIVFEHELLDLVFYM